jgi:hypothetical protein
MRQLKIHFVLGVFTFLLCSSSTFADEAPCTGPMLQATFGAWLENPTRTPVPCAKAGVGEGGGGRAGGGGRSSGNGTLVTPKRLSPVTFSPEVISYASGLTPAQKTALTNSAQGFNNIMPAPTSFSPTTEPSSN